MDKYEIGAKLGYVNYNALSLALLLTSLAGLEGLQQYTWCEHDAYYNGFNGLTELVSTGSS